MTGGAPCISARVPPASILKLRGGASGSMTCLTQTMIFIKNGVYFKKIPASVRSGLKSNLASCMGRCQTQADHPLDAGQVAFDRHLPGRAFPAQQGGHCPRLSLPYLQEQATARG